MKKRYTSLVVAFVGILIVSGCKKSENEIDTTTKLLIASPWKGVKIEWRLTEAGNWILRPDATGGSSLNETVTFFENGSYVSEYSGTGRPGTWQLSPDKTRVTIVRSSGTTSTFTISTLTSTTLQLSRPLEDEYTVSYNPFTLTSYDMEMATFAH